MVDTPDGFCCEGEHMWTRKGFMRILCRWLMLGGSVALPVPLLVLPVMANAS